ncbi:hypothetical protein [Tritonibacter mobilis]|uniref:hypothetical protein n=1 Tax=Tritonibacter mobilis TaxID=379347 RepID=UPI000806A1A4|nr:hypothetical protein [Tritonibacter mobilis]
MTDKPILFSGPMVQAILREIREPGAGKTQTRRVLKTQSIDGYSANGNLVEYEMGLKHGLEFTHIVHGLWHPESNPNGKSAWYVPVPFRTGQRLWVREAHYLTDDGENGYAVYAAEQGEVDEHLANMQTTMASHPSIDWSKHLRLRPSIHMPRWASRITLEVTDVRVQRLQEISEADAVAEGVEPYCGIDPNCSGYRWYGDSAERGRWLRPRDSFRSLWDSLNAERAPWASNPWVVAVSFRPHLTNIDKMEQAG